VRSPADVPLLLAASPGLDGAFVVVAVVVAAADMTSDCKLEHHTDHAVHSHIRAAPNTQEHVRAATFHRGGGHHVRSLTQAFPHLASLKLYSNAMGGNGGGLEDLQEMGESEM
jgi:hypothetical protein